ncbi:hypothetical protein C7M84_016905 [Penaeus vannamei]|uniref:Uncharacterized protein n=1 Tax=Penaeus vannamei TaxID=6689 RepID=A0A423SLX8_PENVA|nr:hypothetical protein C7M84_016905 [Penaeus vannamei]
MPNACAAPISNPTFIPILAKHISTLLTPMLHAPQPSAPYRSPYPRHHSTLPFTPIPRRHHQHALLHTSPSPTPISHPPLHHYPRCLTRPTQQPYSMFTLSISCLTTHQHRLPSPLSSCATISSFIFALFPSAAVPLILAIPLYPSHQRHQHPKPSPTPAATQLATLPHPSSPTPQHPTSSYPLAAQSAPYLHAYPRPPTSAPIAHPILTNTPSATLPHPILSPTSPLSSPHQQHAYLHRYLPAGTRSAPTSPYPRNTKCSTSTIYTLSSPHHQHPDLHGAIYSPHPSAPNFTLCLANSVHQHPPSPYRSPTHQHYFTHPCRTISDLSSRLSSAASRSAPIFPLNHSQHAISTATIHAYSLAATMVATLTFNPIAATPCSTLLQSYPRRHHQQPYIHPSRPPPSISNPILHRYSSPTPSAPVSSPYPRASNTSEHPTLPLSLAKHHQHLLHPILANTISTLPSPYPRRHHQHPIFTLSGRRTISTLIFTLSSPTPFSTLPSPLSPPPPSAPYLHPILANTISILPSSYPRRHHQHPTFTLSPPPPSAPYLHPILTNSAPYFTYPRRHHQHLPSPYPRQTPSAPTFTLSLPHISTYLHPILAATISTLPSPYPRRHHQHPTFTLSSPPPSAPYLHPIPAAIPRQRPSLRRKPRTRMF